MPISSVSHFPILLTSTFFVIILLYNIILTQFNYELDTKIRNFNTKLTSLNSQVTELKLQADLRLANGRDQIDHSRQKRSEESENPLTLSLEAGYDPDESINFFSLAQTDKSYSTDQKSYFTQKFNQQSKKQKMDLDEISNKIAVLELEVDQVNVEALKRSAKNVAVLPEGLQNIQPAVVEKINEFVRSCPSSCPAGPPGPPGVAGPRGRRGRRGRRVSIDSFCRLTLITI